MSDSVFVTRVNSIYSRIEADPAILRELYEHFSFMADNFRFDPRFKAKKWDGKIHLVNLNFQTIYTGLYPALREFCLSRGYEVSTDIPEAKDLPQGFVLALESYLDLPFPLRDYQREAIDYSIKNKGAVNISSTGSGKSMIIYCLTRYYTDKDKKVLIIVPTVSLIHQMVNDFADYSTKNGWNAEENCYRIHAGIDRQQALNWPVVVSTHQSIHALEERARKKWLSQFDVIMADEVHLFAAKTTKGIIENSNCPVRLGFTGTLNDTKTHEWVLQGLFGPIKQHSKTADLIEAGQLAELTIKCITLKHTERPETTLKTYQEEVEYLVGVEKRNRFLMKLAASCEGNTLMLFSLVNKHAINLYESLKAIEDKIGKKVYLIVGDIDPEERERMRKEIETVDNAIIIGSYGVMSTGWNQVSLQNMIFAISGKSKIRNLQSIGRGLRRGNGKTACQVFDVADDLTFGRKKLNHSMVHQMERYDLYMNERFDVKMLTVEV